MKTGERPTWLPETNAHSSRKQAETVIMISSELPRRPAVSHRENQEEAQVSLPKPPAGPNLL
jgi:hypothetical protein